MLKRALDENCNIICLGDLNINCMANIPTNIRDIIFINGFDNIINKPTHFDNRTGNYSLFDPILITDSISIIESDTLHIDREVSDHDGTYVTIGCVSVIIQFRCCLYFDSVSSDCTLRTVLRKRSRIRISLLKVESNQTLSPFHIITSLVGMHILAIFKNIDVKSETAP
jgi:hypothetical protein